MSKKQPQPKTIRYEDSYKQARLYCLQRNGTTHQYRYPFFQELMAIVSVFRTFNKDVYIEIAICRDCRHLKFINFELPDKKEANQ